MYEILTLLFSKYKFFFIGLITGGVLNLFEIQSGNIKWNLGKFIISCLIFGFLTEFSFLLIEGQFIGNTENDNESRVVVLSIIIATTLYLFIPFVLRRDNRDKFLEAVLEKFGFVKNK